jgi:hypothetical protein
VTLFVTVGIGSPFHSATENALKPAPVSVSVSGTPARPFGGVTDESWGTGLVIGARVESGGEKNFFPSGLQYLANSHFTINTVSPNLFPRRRSYGVIVNMSSLPVIQSVIKRIMK